jgi:anti-sigma B factor antagonist
MDYVIKSSVDENLNCWQVSLHGEIDIFSSSNMQSELLSLVDKNNIDLRINCIDLTFIDSTTLGSLVSVQKEVAKYDGFIYLYNVHPNILKLLTITNLNKVFKIVGDYNE